MAWAAIVGSVVTAGAGVYNARRARNQAQNAANEAATTADPFAPMRGNFQEMLLQMFPQLTDFGSDAYAKTDAYKMDVADMEESTNNIMGSQRLLRSGTRPLALMKARAGIADKHRQAMINNNMGLLSMIGGFAGANVGLPGTAGQLQMSGYNSGVSQTNAGINAAVGAMPRLAQGLGMINWNQSNSDGTYGAGTPGGNWDGPGD